MQRNEGFQVQEFVAHATKVNCLCFGPKSNQVLATGGEDSKVNIWKVGNVSNIWTLGYNKSPIESLCFDSEEQCVVSGALNGSLKVFDLNEGRLARNLGNHQVNVCSVQYHPYGEFVVSGSVDCSMKVWDVRNKLCIQTYSGHSKEITCVRFSPDGKWVASASKDGQLLFWDLIAGKLINSIKLSPIHVTSFEFNPQEFSVAAITSARTVKLWDLERMEPTGYTPPESTSVRAIAFSNLGTALCSTASSALKLWDLNPSLKLHNNVEVGWDKIVEMRISNNSQLVAGSCVSNFVSIWSVDLDEYMSAEALHGEDTEAFVDTSQDNYADRQVRTSPRSLSKEIPEEKVTPRNRDQQQNKVREQLSRLENELELMKSESKFDPFDGSRISNKLSDNKNPIDDDMDMQGAFELPDSDAKAVGANSRFQRGSDVVKSPGDFSNDEYDDEFEDDFEEQNNVMGKAKPSEPPAVTWEDNQSPQEMATSMGESFWNRFKESQRKKQQIESDNEEEEDKDQQAQDYRNNNKNVRNQPRPNSKGGMSHQELREKLPPSSYGIAGEDRGSRKSNDAKNTPVDEEESEPSAGRVYTKPAVPVFPKRPPTGASVVPSPTPVETAPSLEVVGQSHQKGDKFRAKGDRYSGASGGNKGSDPDINIYYNPSVPSVSENKKGLSKHGSANDLRQCDSSLDKMLADSAAFRTGMSQRVTTFRILRTLWSRGEITESLEHLTILSDGMTHSPSNLTTIADFFEAVELQRSPISLDLCLKLLPIFDSMLNCNESWTNSHVMIATFKSLIALAEAFGELIQNTRSVMVAGGVDLSREARLEKCNRCHDIFYKAKSRMDQLKRQFRHNKPVLQVFEQYNSLYTSYFQN